MTKLTHAAKDLANDLRELGENISNIGDIIDYGAFSVYIEKLKMFKNDKGLILVITKDKLKFKFLSKLYKKYGIQIESLNEDNLEFQDLDTYYTLQSFGWEFFYVEKVQGFNSFKQTPIIKSLMKVTENCRPVEINGAQLNTYSVRMNIIDCAISNFEHSGREEDFSEEEAEVLEAIEEALKIVKEVSKKDFFRLDLHENQFIKHNGQIVCIDPVEYI